MVNKTYLDAKLSRRVGHLSIIGKDYNGFKELERFNEEVLIEKAVKTTIQTLYEKETIMK